MKYRCGRCGEIFSEEDFTKFGTVFKCPKCGSEIIYKVARNYRLVKAI